MSKIITARKKVFSNFDKVVITFNTLFFSIIIIGCVWNNDLWPLKCWFTLKVAGWAYEFIDQLIKDKSYL